MDNPAVPAAAASAEQVPAAVEPPVQAEAEPEAAKAAVVEDPMEKFFNNITRGRFGNRTRRFDILHVCVRCIMRVNGCSDRNFYMAPSSQLKRLLRRGLDLATELKQQKGLERKGLATATPESDGVPSSLPSVSAPAEAEAEEEEAPTPCPLCFGLLQPELIKTEGEEKESPLLSGLSAICIHVIKEEGHEPDDFSLNLCFPCCLTARQAAALIACPKVPGGAPDPVPLKTIVKLAMAPHIGAALEHNCLSCDAPLVIDLAFKCDADDAEVAEMLGFDNAVQVQRATGWGAHQGKKRKRASKGLQMNQANVMQACAELADGLAKPTLITWTKKWARMRVIPPTYEMSVKRMSQYVLGSYCKLSRCVPQSPWSVGTGAAERTIGEGSVQDIIGAPFAAFTTGEVIKLAGAGREDINVRMLGTGRPFCLEIVNSRKTKAQLEAAMPELERAANERTGFNKWGAVTVTGMKIGTKKAHAKLQVGAEEKRKHYVCVIWCSTAQSLATLQRMLESKTNMNIHQRTPIRVLHRRSPLTRPKTIHEMKVRERLGPHFFILDVTTSAGTYVKEFVHGDLGRTTPNIGSLLGCKCDILQLDVLGVNTQTDAQMEVAAAAATEETNAANDEGAAAQANGDIAMDVV